MKNIFSIKNDAYPLLTLAVPLTLTGLVNSAVWFFETLFLAHVDQATLAAGSLVSWLFGVVAVIMFGIFSSINVLVALRYGENDHEKIRFIAKDGFVLAVLLTIPTFFLLRNMSPVFALFGQPQSVIVLATSYLDAVSWSVLTNFVIMVCLEVLIGIGHTRIIFLFTMLEVSLNIIFSYLLIFGKFGFPALGIAGAGWGITIGYWLAAFVLIIYLMSNKNYRSYFSYIFHFTKPSYLMELMQIGIPMGFMYCVEVAFFFVLTVCMGLLGTDMQAANQIALQYMGLCMSVMFALAQAVTVRMGHLLGAKDVLSARKVNGMGICLAVISMSLVAILYWFFPLALISLDLDIYNAASTEMIDEVKKLLAIGALFQLFEASRIVLFGSLRGLKDTKFTLLISIISFWFIALPIGYVLATYVKLGAAGYWWSMVMGAAFSVVLLQRRFNGRMKRYVYHPVG